MSEFKTISRMYFDIHKEEEQPLYLRGFNWDHMKEIAKNAGVDRLAYEYIIEWQKIGDTEILKYVLPYIKEDKPKKKTVYMINLCYLLPTKTSVFKKHLPHKIKLEIMSYRAKKGITNQFNKIEEDYMFVDE